MPVSDATGLCFCPVPVRWQACPLVRPCALKAIVVELRALKVGAAEVSPATSGDAAVAPTLLADVVSGEDAGEQTTRAVSMATAPNGTGAGPGWNATPGSTCTSPRPRRAG